MKHLLRCAHVGVSSVRQHPLAALLLCAVTLPYNLFDFSLFASIYSALIVFAIRAREKAEIATVSPELFSRLAKSELLKPAVLQMAIFFLIAYLVSLAKEQMKYWGSWVDGMSLNWMLFPVIFYGMAISVVSLAHLLLRNLPEHFKRQIYELSIVTFVSAFVASVVAICYAANGPVAWVWNWLIASTLDANLPMHDFIARHYEITRAGNLILHESGSAQFLLGFKSIATAIFLLSFLQPAVRVGTLLTMIVKHIGNSGSILSRFETAAKEFCQPETCVDVIEDRPWRTNIIKTCIWTVACYVTLFYFYALSSDPIGRIVSGWMDPRFSHFTGVFRWPGLSNVRMFMGSLIALWGTVPLAISGSVFLPYWKSPRIIATNDGILFPFSLYGQLRCRPFRVWQDIKRVKVTKKRMLINFNSGGQIRLRLTQLNKAELDNLITVIESNISRGTKVESFDSVPSNYQTISY